MKKEQLALWLATATTRMAGYTAHVDTIEVDPNDMPTSMTGTITADAVPAPATATLAAVWNSQGRMISKVADQVANDGRFDLVQKVTVASLVPPTS